jgi:hypothetical protein
LLGPGLFQISFPDGEKKMMKYDPNVNLESVLQKTCIQRAFNYDDCTFYDSSNLVKELSPKVNMSDVASRHLKVICHHKPPHLNMG